MEWVTREHVEVGRIACLWLTKKLVDRDAEFIFAPAGGLSRGQFISCCIGNRTLQP
jgi:hypothetical protein